MWPCWSGSSLSMIRAAYVPACFLKAESLLADALIINTFNIRKTENFKQ